MTDEEHDRIVIMTIISITELLAIEMEHFAPKYANCTGDVALLAMAQAIRNTNAKRYGIGVPKT